MSNKSTLQATALLTTQGARLLRIEAMLRNRQAPTFLDMRHACRCSVATLKRDLRCMREELGAPVHFDVSERGYRLIDEWPGVLPALFEQAQREVATT